MSSDAVSRLLVELNYAVRNGEVLVTTKTNLKDVDAVTKLVTADTKIMGAELERSSQRSGASIAQMGERVDRAGRQAMIGLRSLSDFAGLAGADRGFQSIVVNAAMAADATGDLSGMVAALNPGLLLITGVATAAALGFGKIREEQAKAAEAAEKAREAIVAPFEEAKKQIEQLTKVSGLDATAKSLGVSRQALEDFIRSGEAGANTVRALNSASSELAQKQAELVKEQAKLDQLNNEATGYLRDNERGILGMKAAYNMLLPLIEDQSAKVNALKDDIAGLTSVQQSYNDTAQTTVTRFDEVGMMLRSLAILYANIEDPQDIWLAGMKVVREEGRKGSRGLAESAESLKAYEAALKSVAKTVASYISGATGKALTPTAVTQEDMDAAKAGKYVTKWDEFRRRAEAVAKGTDPSAYGEQFKTMFDKLGMGADQVAEKFKNFSLFADPKNFGLVDWGALTTDVEQQLDGLIGKFALTEEANRRIWATMPEEKKNALAKMGIASADDATRKLLGLEPAQYDMLAAPGFAQHLQEIQDAITSNIPSELYSTVHVTYVIDNPDKSNTSEAYKNMKDKQLEGRASGGPVLRGVQYFVGETGRETFTPDQNGYIYSNRETEQMLKGPSDSGMAAAIRDLKETVMLLAGRPPIQVGPNTLSNDVDIEVLMSKMSRYVRRNRS